MNSRGRPRWSTDIYINTRPTLQKQSNIVQKAKYCQNTVNLYSMLLCLDVQSISRGVEITTALQGCLSVRLQSVVVLQQANRLCVLVNGLLKKEGDRKSKGSLFTFFQSSCCLVEYHQISKQLLFCMYSQSATFKQDSTRGRLFVLLRFLLAR